MTPDAASSWGWLPILLWPVTFACILLGTVITRRAAPNSYIRIIVPIVLFLPVPFLVRYLLINSSQSLAHLFDFYFFFVTIGVTCCVGFVLLYFSTLPVANRMGVMIICALAGPFFLFFGLNVLVQDYALSRLVVEGTISRLGVATASRKAPEYEVTIETKRFWATPEIFEALREGERVRAEIGKGSKYIYRIERAPSRS